MHPMQQLLRLQGAVSVALGCSIPLLSIGRGHMRMQAVVTENGHGNIRLMSRSFSKTEQAAMYHAAQHPGGVRSGRLFFLAAFAFCGAALVTGFCFVYAVQAGLDRLAFYHPLTKEQPNPARGSLHPVTLPPMLQT